MSCVFWCGTPISILCANLRVTADGDRQRAAERLHGGRSDTAYPPDETGTGDKLHIVQVGYGLDAHAVLRAHGHLGRQITDGRRDWSANHGVKEAAHRVAGEHDEGTYFIQPGKPYLPSAGGGGAHASFSS